MAKSDSLPRADAQGAFVTVEEAKRLLVARFPALDKEFDARLTACHHLGLSDKACNGLMAEWVAQKLSEIESAA